MWIIFFIILIMIFDIFLDSKYKDFKNEKEEKDLAKIISIIVVIISIILSGIFDSFWVFIIPIIITPTLIIPLITFLLRKNKAQKYMNVTNEKIKSKSTYEDRGNLLDKIDDMSGQEFELLLIEKLLPLDGYTNINGTSYTGDYGVDIIAEKNNIKCAIQCKRFNSKVSVRAIQEIVAGRKHYRCEKAIVITNNYYTKNAKELAFDNKVELLDRDDIIKMIKNTKDTIH